MKKYIILKTIALLVLILSVGISPAWGAKIIVIVYVDASASAGGDGMSWETAFTDLQDALAAAVSGDEIWVAAGTYKPTITSDRSVSFVLKSDVAIYGGFAGGEKALRERSLDPSLTVLSGDIGTIGDDKDNSYHVVYAEGVTGAVLDGFTVTRGRGDSFSAGAGMYNENSSLTVSNCIFSHNKVAVTNTGYYMGAGRGGGMCNKNSAPIVTNCTFIANQAGESSLSLTGAGGGMCNDGNFDNGVDRLSPVITNCTFSDNVASARYDLNQEGGGGIYNGPNTSPIIDRCIFERNIAGFGGGMLNYLSQPIITNCIFNTNSNNASNGYGGAIYNLASATILNCTFYQNGWRLMPIGYPEPRFRPYTTAGGAVFDYRAPSTIFNCIFSNNAVRAFGGAIVSEAIYILRGTSVTNSFFYENITWNGYNDPRDVEINHLHGNFHPDSVGNLYDIDPLLADPESGDFHLDFDSPCIDAGYALTFGYLPLPYPFGLPDTDFDGDKRIADSDGDGSPAIDIGADEVIPNISDLGWFIQSLADTGEIDQAVANSLLVYVDDAQAALDQEDEQTAINLLNDLIAAAWDLLEDTGTAQMIEMKTRAVIEEI